MPLKKKILFTFIVLFLTFSTAFIFGEFYYRFKARQEQGRKPKGTAIKIINRRATTVDINLGMIFLPWRDNIMSNGIEFNVKSKTNRYGFLDRDYEMNKDPGTTRILFIGDSYIEASYLDHSDKIQCLLELKLNQNVKKKVQCIALAHSGMGTVNEFSYLEHLGRKFNPDIIILMFIKNDFANNSPLLHAIAEGWHPNKSPRFFWEWDHRKNELNTLPITIHYQDHYIPIRTKPTFEEAPIVFLDSFFKKSAFYLKVSTYYKAYIQNQKLLVKMDDIYTQRIKVLNTQSFYREKIQKWNYPQDLDKDDMFNVVDREFYSNKVALVFQEAVLFTEHAITNFKRVSEELKSKLIMLSGPNLYNCKITKNYGREINPHGMYEKLKKITNKHDIPLINLTLEFLKRGPLNEARWKYDSHWNKKGVNWATDALYHFLIQNHYFELKSE